MKQKMENVVTVDVDNTLVLHKTGNFDDSVEFKDPYNGNTVRVRPHHGHINLLKHFSDRGWHVIVWSGSGGEWAKCVVKALGLDDYVDDIMAKPRNYIDDLEVQEWMGNRIYFDE